MTFTPSGLTDQGFKDSFAFSSVGFVLMDVNGRFLEVNDAFRNMLGYGLDEILRLSFPEITAVEDLPNNLIKVGQLIRGELSNFLTEKRYLHKDGRFVWAKSNVTAIKDESGKVTRIVAIVQDIDVLKRSEQSLRETVKYRDEFLAYASHELRTPLTAIKLNAQMLRRLLHQDCDHETLIKRVDQLTALTDEGMNRMSRQIDNMLDITRIQEGNLNLEKELVEIGGLLRWVFERYQAELGKANVTCAIDLPPSLMVEADPSRLEQVFSNLFLNCIQHAPGSALRIRGENSSATISLTFEDDGPGIPREDYVRIFNRHEKLLSTTKVNGLGLGLYIVKSILQIHGGEIHLDPMETGSKFIITLPAVARSSATVENSDTTFILRKS